MHCHRNTNGAITGAFGYLFNQIAVKGGFGFKTVMDAARAALEEWNPTSIRDNLEYGGLIYRQGDQFGYTAYSCPQLECNIPSRSPGVAAGDWHTHGDYS